jgi:hypothetical protein
MEVPRPRHRKITSAKGAKHELDVLSDSNNSVHAVSWDSSSYGQAKEQVSRSPNGIQLSPQSIESEGQDSQALPPLRSQALVTPEQRGYRWWPTGPLYRAVHVLRVTALP